MRLFTALWVPPFAAAGLRALTAQQPVPSGWRAVDPSGWHLTLVFHGEADPQRLYAALDRAARGLPAPRLRLRGAGGFPTVRWAGVQAEPAERLADLVAAAGGEPATFVPHVTVWRRAGRAAHREPVPRDEWSGYEGPWWRPADVVLVRSDTGRDDTGRDDTGRGDTGRGDTGRGDTGRRDPGQGGSRYQVLHRTSLRSG